MVRVQKARAKNLERVTFLNKQPHGIIHQRMSILKPENKSSLSHPREKDLPGCCTFQTFLSQSPSLPFPSPSPANREASESTEGDNRLGYNPTNTEPSIRRLRTDPVAQVPVRLETRRQVPL